jgi:hypothetical protein
MKSIAASFNLQNLTHTTQPEARRDGAGRRRCAMWRRRRALAAAARAARGPPVNRLVPEA